MLRVICSAIDGVAGPAELPVRLTLSSGLLILFFQVFWLGIEGTASVHGQWEPHIMLLDKFSSDQIRPLAKSPRMVDGIAGHHEVLRDIRHILETHGGGWTGRKGDYEGGQGEV